MQQWKALCNAFGEELLCHDLRGLAYLANACCCNCGTVDNVCHWCTECMHANMLYTGCLITRH
jgi:hypothetical protein